MPRNPGNADKLMLEAAKKIIIKDGCSGLRIRDVVDRAGVNLGMFHYHFKSKEQFKRLALLEIYEKFFEKLMLASKEGKNALEQLRNSLFVMGCFVRDEREFYLAVLKDFLNDEVDVFEMIGNNGPRHAMVISGLIDSAQSEGSIKKLSFHEVMPVLMGGIHLPVLVGAAFEKRSKTIKKKNKRFPNTKEFFKKTFSDDYIRMRIDIVLKGLAP
jgi:AcrR family transcriptional regulator